MFKNEADFKRLTDRLNIDDKPNSAHRGNLRRQMLSAFNEAGQRPATRTIVFRTLGRTIMKSKITKLAAAAVIIFAVLISFNILDVSTPAFAEIVKPLLTARTATFEMEMKVEGSPTQTFDCIYAEPIRMRQTNKENNAIVISDLQQGKIVTLMPAQKKAVVMELENRPDNQKQSQFNMFGEIRKHIQEAQEKKDESIQFLGEKKINGLTVIGYHVQKAGFDITVWADPQTKLPVQIEQVTGPISYIMDDIVFDVELDESLFSLEVPAEYTIQTMQVDASEATEKDLTEMFQTWAEYMDNSLPSALDMNAPMEFMKYQVKKAMKEGREPSEESVLELQKIILRMGRGLMFIQSLPKESDWHYFGKGVKFGDANTPVFWYRPKGSEAYRVIYGDLSIREVSADQLPESSEAKPISGNTSDGQALIDKANAMGADIPAEKRDVVERMFSLNEKDLIAGLRVFSELSDGRYPSKLDTKSTLKETNGLGADIFRNMSKEVKEQKLQDIFFACAYYDKLVREKKDVIYYGEKVTAKDSNKVLIRWRIREDKSRIVFGNLTTKDLAAKDLSKLEKNYKLPSE